MSWGKTKYMRWKQAYIEDTENDLDSVYHLIYPAAGMRAVSCTRNIWFDLPPERIMLTSNKVITAIPACQHTMLAKYVFRVARRDDITAVLP